MAQIKMYTYCVYRLSKLLLFGQWGLLETALPTLFTFFLNRLFFSKSTYRAVAVPVIVLKRCQAPSSIPRPFLFPAMKVYTRTGDKGETSLFNGTRVPKNHALVDAYGTVDECNAAIGLATSHLATPPYPLSDTESDRQKLLSRLQLVQHYLFDLGAHLATPRTTSPSAKLSRTQFSSNAAAELEIWIDEMDTKLEPLTTFVLPGGHPSAAALHLARTIARRAERAVTPLRAQQQSQMDSSAYCFINRLSDFLFVSSRFANLIMGSQDVKWRQITTRPDIPSSKNAV